MKNSSDRFEQNEALPVQRTVRVVGSPFHPVVRFSEPPLVLDLRWGEDARALHHRFTIGKYSEQRRSMYTTALFTHEGAMNEPRDFHVGVDLGAPAGETVYAFTDCEVWSAHIRSAPNFPLGDYGGTVVTRARLLSGAWLYALHGHLSHSSVENARVGQRIAKGERIGEIGLPSENGGWPHPHVHFQLSLEPPVESDLPGVVGMSKREQALEKYPDPRTVLGAIF